MTSTQPPPAGEADWSKQQGSPQPGYPAAPPAYPSAPPPGGAGYPTPNGGLPPGVELASRGRRIGAFFLAIPLMIVTLIIGYYIWGAVLWGKGTSPALRVLGCRCWKEQEGRPATWGTMALRDIVGGIVQGILSIITALISFIMFLSGEKRQSIPDKIGGTIVVYDPNKVLG